MMNDLRFDINNLSNYKEDNRLEVKKASGGLPHSIWETYSSFSNPGDMRVSVSMAKEGGFSDPRNATLMKMFSLIGIGDRAGMGIPDLIDIWQRLTGFAPVYVSQFSPNRVNVSLQIKAIGDKSVTNGQIGDKSAINGQIGDKSEENITVEQKLSTIIEYMQTHQPVTAMEIAEVLSIKASRTRDYLRLLVARGALVTNGANKNRTYMLKRQ